MHVNVVSKILDPSGVSFSEILIIIPSVILVVIGSLCKKMRVTRSLVIKNYAVHVFNERVSWTA